ncbi:MAG: (Fe-S)-binding protein [Negativicutes bacterium]|nr:(Fe-S)-binding protein [Negativicutes bacterium]
MGGLADVYEMLNRCNKCGFCHAACKSYKSNLGEPMVARGRVQLIKAVAEGTLEPDRDYENAINSCLLCGECAIACPSGVKANELVMAARRDLKKRKGISGFAKRQGLKTLASPGRLGLAFKSLRTFRSLVLSRVNGLDSFRGIDIKGMPVNEKPFLQQVPAVSPAANPTRRVAFFPGCMINHTLDRTGHAIIQVLNRNGCDVVMAKNQVCCGMPQYAYGDFETAKDLARKNISLLTGLEADAVITACATCGSMIKEEYPKLFADEPDYLPQVREFCGKVFEFSRFLLSELKLDVSQFKPILPVQVTYHDPCHLVRYQKITQQPRELLKSIPRLQFVEMKEADRCCGAAGLVQAFFPDESNDITRQKLKNIEDSGADIVVTSCPACLHRIQGALNLAGKNTKVVHLADMLAKAYGGPAPV